jgi:hypothetical protein
MDHLRFDATLPEYVQQADGALAQFAQGDWLRRSDSRLWRGQQVSHWPLASV